MKESVTSTHFIHALGPEVVRVVEGEVKDAGVVVEATQVLETLLDLTPEQSSEYNLYPTPVPRLFCFFSFRSLDTGSYIVVWRTYYCTCLSCTEAQMLGLLLPLLVSALAVGSSTTKQQRQVHDHVLQRLMQIGPKYPVAFRAVMQSSPTIKQQLEEAIRASQSSAQTPSREGRRQQLPQQHTPSIKLKMDFSNFR